MRRTRVLTVAKKDLRQFWRDKQAALPLVLVPLLIVGVIPAAVLFALRTPSVQEGIHGVLGLVGKIPAGIDTTGLPDQSIVALVFCRYLLPPLVLLIPIMVSTMTACASFVGERERKTIEGLLQTPLEPAELVAAKMLAPLIPAVAITWAGCLLLFAVIGTVGHPLLELSMWLSPTWLVVVVLLVPLSAVLGVEVTLAVSQRTTTTRSAQNQTSLLVLPVIGFLFSQLFGALALSGWIILAATIVLALADLVLFLLVVRRTDAERLIIGRA
jgi:ABC-type Na+ efflux pump permease subunit